MSGRARDLDDVDQVIEQVRALARFPSENPNPVMRLTAAGRVLYANAAAKQIGGLLVGRGKDRLAKRLIVAAAKADGETIIADRFDNPNRADEPPRAKL